MEGKMNEKINSNLRLWEGIFKVKGGEEVRVEGKGNLRKIVREYVVTGL